MSTFNHGPESRIRGAKNLRRNQLRIATLNVRTLTQAGSLEALKMDLAQYKLDILGVQETRLQEQEIDLGDHKLYLSDSWLSGVKSRQGGVGVAVKKSLINSIVEQVALSELLAETSSQSRLTISTEVLLGTKKKAGWFETQDGRKLRLKSLAVAKPALVASQQQSAVADSESLENESRSVVADQESLRCQNCQRQFSTVTGRKVHQTRFCKAGLSKNVVDKSKFEQLEASLTCDKCERKFKTVNGRKVHQSRYCGKPKAVATRVFSCKVQDVLGNEFENIEAFKYLGSYVSLKHGDLQEVNCKLAEGRQRFANFQNLWKSKQLSVHLKCNLYKALVLSAVLYSSETWTLSKLMERKLESFHCGCLRRILRVSYLEKATNEEIMSRSRMPQLSTMIMLKRIKWYGHIQRMEPGRLARSAFDWDPPDQYVHARRAPGGQRKTWMSQIEGDCVRNKVSFTRLQEKAATGSKNAFNNFVVQHFTE